MSTVPVKLAMCSGCRQPITDRYFLSAAGPAPINWHCDSCLRCHYCQQVLDGHGSCFIRHGFVFCRSDYERLFCHSSDRIVCGSLDRLHHDDSSPLSHSARDLTADNRVNKQPSTDHDDIQLSGQRMKVSSSTNDCGSYVGDRSTMYPCIKQATISGTIGDRKRVVDNHGRRRSRNDVIRRRVGCSQRRLRCGGASRSLKKAQKKCESSAVIGSGGGGGGGGGSSSSSSSSSSSNNNNNNNSNGKSAERAIENGINIYTYHEDDAAVKINLPQKKVFISSKRNFFQTSADDADVSRGKSEEVVLSAAEGISNSSPSPSRFRRLRTSFKQQQLRLMKTYFSLNNNPDSNALKSLASKTGLDGRVLQVWFQNARAKQRRRDLRERQTVGVSDSSSLSERLPDDGQSTAEDEVYWDATTKLAVDLSSTLGAQMEISSSQFFSRVDGINCSLDSVTNLDHNVMINVMTTDGNNDLLA